MKGYPQLPHVLARHSVTSNDVFVFYVQTRIEWTSLVGEPGMVSRLDIRFAGAET